MNRKYRKTVITANWKMYKTASETRAYLEALKGALPRTKRCSVVLCVPFIDIPMAVKHLKDSRIAVGAQNLHWARNGPYTGEISGAMLADLDVKYVIVGHSERRSMAGETDLDVNRKLRAALDAGLRPILCVGEDAARRKLGITQEHITCQLKTALAGVTPEEMRRVILTYEPVWAMESGQAVLPREAGQICADIRSVIRKLYDARIARSTTIQYGGPMDEGNTPALLAQEDVDGGLIGAASLSVSSFLSIVCTANQE